MSVPAAYLGVVLIWSTTPLAIKWSATGASFSFALLVRMVIGLALSLLIMKLMRVRMPRDPAAWHTYLAGGLGLAGTMLCVYASAVLVPSGLISVLFGLSPLATGLFAHYLLGEKSFAPSRLFGMLLGLTGLALIFSDGHAGANPWGVFGIVTAMSIQSLSAVLVKRSGAHMHPLAMNTGVLAVALVPFLLAWLWQDGGHWPVEVSTRTAWAIAYLGVFGSFVGFVLYFFVLRRISASAMALSTLVTPVAALSIGHLVNGEVVEPRVWAGTAVILSGLLVFQFGGRVLRRLRRVLVPA